VKPPSPVVPWAFLVNACVLFGIGLARAGRTDGRVVALIFLVVALDLYVAYLAYGWRRTAEVSS